MNRVSIKASPVAPLSFAALLAFGVLAGCGASREAAWESTTPSGAKGASLTDADRQAALADGEALFAERLDEQKLKAAIAKWEQVAGADPKDFETMIKLARAHYFWADGHMSFSEARTDELIATHEKAVQWAERALVAVSPDFAERMRNGTRIEEAVKVLDKRAVGALYWRSAAMGKWALAKGFATVLSYKDEVRAIMARCLELDEAYFFGGPHRYFGAFYAKLPSFAGGDLKKSAEHFEKALQFAPEYQGTRVLYAEQNAVKAQDKKLFETQLNAVVAANLDALPEAKPENTVEQKRAKALLAKESELFE